MGRIEELAEQYARHMSTPWQRTVSGAQRVVIVVYDKELERTLRARRAAFENATREAGYKWREVDLTDCFATWMAADEYKEAYFSSPGDLQLKLTAEFTSFAADRIKQALQEETVDPDTVVAVLGTGSLFGFARASQVIQSVELDIRGRMVVFFPGQFDRNNYRLLDARDGWNYLAVPITLYNEEGVTC
jgi:hypothetical protein